MIKDNASMITLDQTEPLYEVCARASIFISLKIIFLEDLIY